MTSKLPETTDVLVVGGGPIGMTLALTLQRAGINHVVLDEKPGPRPHSKACVLWPRSLEIFDLLGVSAKWYDDPLPIRAFTIALDETVEHVRLWPAQSPHPYGLLVGQDVSERHLDDALRERDAPVVRNATVRAVEIASDAATVRYDCGDDSNSSIRARFVVGCDGSSSVVRTAAGIEREGTRNSGVQLVQGDVRIGGSLTLDPSGAYLWSDAAGTDLFVLPLTSDGHYRVLAIVDDDGREGDPTLEELQTQSIFDLTRRTDVRGRLLRVLLPHALHLPGMDRQISAHIDELDVRYGTSIAVRDFGGDGIEAGRSAPDALVNIDGRTCRLFDVFRRGTYTAIAWASRNQNAEAVFDGFQSLSDDSGVECLFVSPEPVQNVRGCRVAVDRMQTARARYGVRHDTIHLVRPDGVIGARGPANRLREVLGELAVRADRRA